MSFPSGNQVDGLLLVANNNATREKAGNEKENIFMTNGVFNIELLRLHTSDRDDILRERISAQREIMRPWRTWVLKELNSVHDMGSSDFNCSGSTNQIVMRFSGNHFQASRKVVLEAHDN